MAKHPNLHRKKALYLKHVKVKGRGVFCRTAIKKGGVLELSPAVILNEKETDHADETILLNYTFIFGGLSKGLRRATGVKRSGDCSCLIMGIMSFCNHDEDPNAEIVWEEIDGTLYYSLQATRAIPKNTEICTVYGDHWFEERKQL
jgi:SET domain-containing protein